MLTRMAAIPAKLVEYSTLFREQVDDSTATLTTDGHSRASVCCRQ